MNFTGLILLCLVNHASALTDACTMLPFDNYDDLSCKVSGWYNDTKLPCNTYQAADTEDASFLYVPLGLTVTIYCPFRTVLIGASTYKCTEEGFDPPIQTSNYTDRIDPHPVCLGVDYMQDGLCATESLARSGSNYQLYSDADYVFAGQKYQVECETGFSVASTDQERMQEGECTTSGKWNIRGSACLGMCIPEVRYGGAEQNTGTDYANYVEISVSTELGAGLQAVGAGLQAVGTQVNVSITCQDGTSPTGTRSGDFVLTCSVANSTVREGMFSHTRYEDIVNCRRNCEVPTLPEGRLIDPWTGMTLVPGTMTLMNGEDAARMRCPAGTYALGRVRIACYDGEIPHPLPTCTRSLQPCESPLVDHGMRDPYNLPPGAQYTLKCSPGFALPVTVSLTVKCRELRGRLTDLGVPAAELSPAASYTCFKGCQMPFSTLSHGFLYPAPRLSTYSAPYQTGQSITITCFGDYLVTGHVTHHVFTCLWDGWDSEEWPDCTPVVVSGSTAARTSLIAAVYLILWL